MKEYVINDRCRSNEISLGSSDNASGDRASEMEIKMKAQAFGNQQDAHFMLQGKEK